MFVCVLGVRRIAEWLLALPVPDPELQCEVIGWAMGLLWLAEGIEQGSGRAGQAVTPGP